MDLTPIARGLVAAGMLAGGTASASGQTFPAGPGPYDPAVPTVAQLAAFPKTFSTAPLRIATYVGVLSALLAFAAGVWIVLKTLLWGDPVAGYPSLMVAMLLLGGVQLMALGIIGEYLGRLYMESKARPLYLVDELRQGAALRAPSDLNASPTGLSSR